ncbi:MAG: serpin family protein [Fibrobacteria bacterium]
MIDIAGKSLGLIAVLCLIAFPGCEKRGKERKAIGSPAAEARPASLKEWSQGNKELIRAEQDFAFRLLQNLLVDAANRNQFISPLSLQIALGMAWMGARNATADSMAAGLGWTGMPQESVSHKMAWLQEALLAADPKVKMELANAIFHDTSFAPDSGFLEKNQKSYNATVRSLDFSNPKEALEVINGWADAKTQGKIPRIVWNIDPSNLMALCNAVYFKGAWSRGFDTGLTSTGEFHLSIDAKIPPTAGRRTTSAVYLNRTDSTEYFEDGEAQWARIPYGDSLFSMIVVLPKTGTALPAFSKSLTAGTWIQSLSRFQPVKIRFSMPRHKIEASYGEGLEKVLARMGMGIAFGGDADFSGISKAIPFSIGAVVHKSIIETDEKGSEAAAVTVLRSLGAARVKENPIPVLRLDRPYLFAIAEKQTGAILFLGAMNNPNPTDAHYSIRDGWLFQQRMIPHQRSVDGL